MGDLIYDLAIGYIAAYMFYLLVSDCPSGKTARTFIDTSRH
jgi:hypothetical protein